MKHKNDNEYFEPTAWQIMAKWFVKEMSGMGCFSLALALTLAALLAYMYTLEMMAGGC